MPISSPKILPTSNKLYQIEMEAVNVNFGNLTVLKDITLQLKPGCFLYVIGPNGAGKSTFIKLLVGLLKPSSGNIFLNTNKVGYLPQINEGKNNFPITVKEVMYTGFHEQSIKIKPTQNAIIKMWAEKMDVTHLLDSKMEYLSGGQKQRVFLARALISEPELLILDEPTTALDPSFREEFYRLIQKLNSEGVSLIYVTHDLTENMHPEHQVIYIDQEIKFFGPLKQYLALKKEHHHVHHD